MELLDRWDDAFSMLVFMEIGINRTQCVCVKHFCDTGNTYVMDCENGKEVYYRRGYGTDRGIRNLTDKERAEVMEFVEEQIETGREINYDCR